MSRFTVAVEPAHDREDLAGIVDRLGRPMSDDGLRVWYPRDVETLLRRVRELGDARAERLWRQETARRLRDEAASAVEAAEAARRSERQALDRLAEREAAVERLEAELEATLAALAERDAAIERLEAELGPTRHALTRARADAEQHAADRRAFATELHELARRVWS